MPRLPRIYFEKALYYVTSESGQGRNLFNDKADYESYSELLGKYKREYGFKLFAFILLPKQLHLLIELRNDVTISTIMHSLNSTYTKIYNSKYDKKGHLFQQRFKAILIEKDGLLLRLTRYIHLNAKRIGLADDIKNYAYSSLHLYAQTPQDKFIEMNEEVSEVFNCQKQNSTVQTYEDYVNLSDTKEREDMYKLLHRKQYIGSDEFVEAVKKEIENASKEEERVRISRPPYKVFVLAGSLAILILGIIAFRLYSQMLGWQRQFTTAVDVYNERVRMLREDMAKEAPQEEIKVVNKDLNGSMWEVEISNTTGEKNPHIDRLGFKNGKFISESLATQGYTDSYYSITIEDDGAIVWETMQTRADGTTANWYGIWKGSGMKGILSERPVEGEARDFSFFSKRWFINGS